jgi:hypothetical protein
MNVVVVGPGAQSPPRVAVLARQTAVSRILLIDTLGLMLNLYVS